VVAEAPPAPEPPPAPKVEKPEFNLRATASLIEGGPQLEEALAWEIFPVVNGEVAPDAVECGYNRPFEVALPAGDYELRASGGKAVRSLRVTLSDTETQTPHVVLDAGWLTVRARFSEGGDLANGAYLWVRAQEGAEEGGYTETRMLMPAGPAVASAELSKAKTEQPVEIVAGEEREVDLVLGAGVVRVSALYASGGPAAESGIRFDVLAAKADINGNRDEFNGSYGPDALNVPAGRYVLNAQLEGAVVQSEPFDVAPGELVEVQVVLNAGVAAMSAPGAYRIDVFGPPKITGEREELAGAYGDAWSYTLKAGTYRARASYEGDRAPVEADFTVTAGERVELRLQ
jgi:Ca-activated chloride channel family protein